MAVDELPRVVMIILVIILIIVGVFGNLAIMFVISLTKELWTSTNAFIINLAVADMCIAAFVDPYNAVGIQHDTYLLDHHIQCEVVGTICTISCTVSLATVATISFNRYMFVCYNYWHDKIFTRKKCIVMVICLWLYGTMVDFPLHFGWGRHGYDLKTMGCTYDRTDNYGYTLYTAVFNIGIPVMIVGYCYTSIYVYVRGSRMHIEGAHNVARVKHDDLKLIKTLVIMCVTFFICWTPYGIVVLADFEDNWPQPVHFIAIIMAHASSSINCIIYGFTNEKFRRGLFHLLGIGRAQVNREHGEEAAELRPPSHSPNSIEMFIISKPLSQNMVSLTAV